MPLDEINYGDLEILPNEHVVPIEERRAVPTPVKFLKSRSGKRFRSERGIPQDDDFDPEVLAILNRIRETDGVIKDKYRKKKSDAERQAEADAGGIVD